MSDAAAPTSMGRASRPRRRRSYIAAVAYQTLGRTGARVGAVWLVIIGFAAVFAPLLASSHPLVMKTVDGTVSSPWLKHLTPADIAVPLVTLAAVVCLLLKRVSMAKRWIAFLVFAGVVITATNLWVKPPLTVVYDTYREMDRRGEIAWQINTPIPYSASDRLRDLPDMKLSAPSSSHYLGTTINGADLTSRMIHASRIAMSVGFIATGIALVIGVFIGGLMGYFSKSFDLLGMRLVEIFEAIPQLYLLLTFVAFFPRNLYIMMAIIGLTSWTGYARFTRAEFLKLRQQDFVQAAKAYGAPLGSILFKHMLPNGVAPVLVSASFGVASAILAEAFLSFLGLGLVDEPSWGQMLSQAVGSSGGFTWWMATFPGLAIFLTVFAYNLLGESLRDAIDPKVTGTQSDD